MPRLKVIEPATSTGRVKEIFDGPLKGKTINIFKGMANAPALLDSYLGLAGALNKASLSKKEQETVLVAVGEAEGCEYCVAAHTQLGKAAGLSEAQIVGARRGSVEDDPKLSALARFAQAIHEKHGHVSDADLAEFREVGYDDQAIAEVVALYAMAIMTATFNHVNQTAIDFPPAPAL